MVHIHEQQPAPIAYASVFSFSQDLRVCHGLYGNIYSCNILDTSLR